MLPRGLCFPGFRFCFRCFWRFSWFSFFVSMMMVMMMFGDDDDGDDAGGWCFLSRGRPLREKLYKKFATPDPPPE